MPACSAEAPGLYRTEPGRAVACLQYREHPAINTGDLSAVLSRGPLP
jgi:hypothetical protein